MHRDNGGRTHSHLVAAGVLLNLERFVLAISLDQLTARATAHDTTIGTRGGAKSELFTETLALDASVATSNDWNGVTKT